MAIEQGGTGLPVEHPWEQCSAGKPRLERTPHLFSRRILPLAIPLPSLLPEALTQNLGRRNITHKPLRDLLGPERDPLAATRHIGQYDQWVGEPRQQGRLEQARCRGFSQAGALTL